jgi:hypothetical protein
VTISGVATVAQNASKIFIGRVTGVTTPAITYYGLGSTADCRRVRLASLALHLQPCHQAGLFFYPSAWIVWASTPSAASAPKKPPPPNHPPPHPHWIAPPPQLQTPNQGAPAKAM